PYQGGGVGCRDETLDRAIDGATKIIITTVNLKCDDNMFQDAAILDPPVHDISPIHSSPYVSLEKNGTWDIVHLPKEKKTKGGFISNQILGIDYNDIDFLHGELEEEIYMDQVEGFMVPGKENFLNNLWGLVTSFPVYPCQGM
ncbi:hypothetical protein ACJX0J_028638, partial [Zea mays]